jgi:hypothetical protein
VLGNVPLFVEIPTAKVAGDLSLVGLAVYAWLFGSLILFAFRAARWARTAQDSAAAVDAAALVAVVLLVVYTGYDLAVSAVTFWLLAGLFAGSFGRANDPVTDVRGGPATAPSSSLVESRA